MNESHSHCVSAPLLLRSAHAQTGARIEDTLSLLRFSCAVRSAHVQTGARIEDTLWLNLRVVLLIKSLSTRCVQLQGPVSERRLSENSEYVNPEMRETLGFPFQNGRFVKPEKAG